MAEKVSEYRDKADKTLTVEESFKDSLKDVVAILERLAPHYRSLDDVIATANLAMENDVHLDLLMSVVLKKK